MTETFILSATISLILIAVFFFGVMVGLRALDLLTKAQPTKYTQISPKSPKQPDTASTAEYNKVVYLTPEHDHQIRHQMEG